jgi:hypothetical protein
VVSLTPRPRFSPGEKTQVSIVHEAGWAPEPVWTQRLEEKSFRLCQESNLDRPVFQPVARHYTDWATRLTKPDSWEPKQDQPHDSRISPNADSDRHHYTHQHSRGCISCYHSRHRQKIISVVSTSHERRTRPVKHVTDAKYYYLTRKMRFV